jgi:3-hydroxyacyl-CoA dehydrogenase
MSAYVTKSLYLGSPEQAASLLKQIDEAKGTLTFAQFVIEAIKEKLASKK